MAGSLVARRTEFLKNAIIISLILINLGITLYGYNYQAWIIVRSTTTNPSNVEKNLTEYYLSEYPRDLDRLKRSCEDFQSGTHQPLLYFDKKTHFLSWHWNDSLNCHIAILVVFGIHVISTFISLLNYNHQRARTGGYYSTAVTYVGAMFFDFMHIESNLRIIMHINTELRVANFYARQSRESAFATPNFMAVQPPGLYSASIIIRLALKFVLFCILLEHPDKNPSKEAEKNFIEATKAYEILSSPEKRAKYDAYGIVDLDVDDLRSGSVNDPSFGSDLFANIFGGYHRPFDRFRESANVQVVTFHNYKVNYHPASRTTPLMLLGISHFCFICRRIQPLWSKIASQYSNLGVTFGVANIQDDQALREELNVLHSPSVVAVIDGKVNYFMGMDYTESSIVDFLVQSLLESSPSRSAPMPGLLSTTLGAPLFTIISNEKVLDNFLMDWLEDSRPRALFFKSTEQPPLRFCLAAFRAADFHASGYVNSHLPSAKSLLKRFNLSQNEENILIFHESPQEPVISQAAVHLSRKVLDDVLMQNSRLSVPRILSSVRFLDLCPADGHPPSSAFASAAETDGGSHTSHRHLCFVLLLNHRIGLKVGSKQRAWLDLFRSALVPAIPHALTSALGLTGRLPDDFRPILSPAYMFSDRQAAWLKNVTASSTCPACLDQIQATAGYILALWRLSSRTLAFRLLPRQMGLHPAEVLPANLTVDAPSIEVYTGRLKTSLTNLVMDMVKVDAFLRGRDAKEVKEDVSGWSIAYLPRMEVLLRDELAASLGVRIKRKLWSMGLAALSYFDRFTPVSDYSRKWWSDHFPAFPQQVLVGSNRLPSDKRFHLCGLGGDRGLPSRARRLVGVRAIDSGAESTEVVCTSSAPPVSHPAVSARLRPHVPPSPTQLGTASRSLFSRPFVFLPLGTPYPRFVLISLKRKPFIWSLKRPILRLFSFRLTSGADCGSVLLTPSTYERLVPGAPPGQVSVILCTDASPLGQRLANQFFQISRRMGSGANVRIVPASLFVDHYPEWLGWALEAATRIPFTPSFSPRGVDAAGGGTPPATLTFNPANCRGTVFAVNGFRRYFHMYHPLLPGSQSRPFVEVSLRFTSFETTDKLIKVFNCTRSLLAFCESDEVDADVCCAPRGPSKEARRFANFNKLLGLSHSDNESDYETESETEEECLAPVTPLLEQELLAGLVAWFDRLFEGSLRRHHVSEWPRSLTLSTK
ncbi:unnamed protein product [Mesocestoides corti]|uniref:J domain-containing protein n=2 Tax=Mesocestoides corti TaxID=53468 RepID=A0A0R3UF45_MESCO|nr:unnamed protein product [Mesocestoides corti]